MGGWGLIANLKWEPLQKNIGYNQGLCNYCLGEVFTALFSENFPIFDSQYFQVQSSPKWCRSCRFENLFSKLMCQEKMLINDRQKVKIWVYFDDESTDFLPFEHEIFWKFLRSRGGGSSSKILIRGCGRVARLPTDTSGEEPWLQP